MDDIKNIENELIQIYAAYKKKIFISKSSEKNNYHIFIPSIIFKNTLELKNDLENKIPKVNFDR